MIIECQYQNNGLLMSLSDYSAEYFLGVATLPVETYELPPPYTPSAQGNIPVINCKVCQTIISLDGRQHSYVVKCPVCNEATVSMFFFAIMFV